MDNAFKIAPLALLFSLVIKTVISGGNFADSISILGTCALIAAIFYKSNNKEIKVLNEKLNDINKTLNQKGMELDAVKNHLSTIKLQQQMRGNKIG